MTRDGSPDPTPEEIERAKAEIRAENMRAMRDHRTPAEKDKDRRRKRRGGD